MSERGKALDPSPSSATCSGARRPRKVAATSKILTLRMLASRSKSAHKHRPFRRYVIGFLIRRKWEMKFPNFSLRLEPTRRRISHISRRTIPRARGFRAWLSAPTLPPPDDNAYNARPPSRTSRSKFGVAGTSSSLAMRISSARGSHFGYYLPRYPALP